MAMEVIMWDKTSKIDYDEGVRINLGTLLKRMWAELRRKALIILILVAVSGAVFYAGAKLFSSPSYKATATFTYNRATGTSYRTGAEKNAVILKQSKIFPNIMMCNALRNLVMDDLGYAGSSSFNVKINAVEQENINVVSMTVSADDPQLAYDTVHSLLRNVTRVTEPAFGDVEIKILSESGVPTSLSGSVSGKKSAAAGVVLCLILVMIWLIVRSLTDTSISHRNELSRALDTEVLGAIPAAKRAGLSGAKLPIIIDAEGASTEMIGSVHTILHRIEKEAKADKMKSILVTSALGGEGKTSTAANLAIALAGQGNKVALVEGNLRNPSILSTLGAPQKEKGLVDLLSGRCKAEDVMIPYAKNSSLTLIPGGKLNAIPATLWSSTAAEQFFKQLKDDFDYILIDSSASASLSDSGLLAKFADGYVYVVKKAYAQLPVLRKGVETLSNCGCRAIGSVLNAD